MNKYEQIGQLIFGVQRLDGALQSLDRQFSGADPDLHTMDPAGRFERRIALARAYFLANNISKDLAAEYEKCAAAIRDLDISARAMTAERADGLDGLLLALRDAHCKIADLIDAVGSNAYPTAALRTRAAA